MECPRNTCALRGLLSCLSTERSGVDELLAGGVDQDRVRVRVDLVPDDAPDVHPLVVRQAVPVRVERRAVVRDGRVLLAGLGADALLDDQLPPPRFLEGSDLVAVLHVTGVRMELAGASLAGVLQLVLAGAVLAVRLRSSHGSLLSR